MDLRSVERDLRDLLRDVHAYEAQFEEPEATQRAYGYLMQRVKMLADRLAAA